MKAINRVASSKLIHALIEWDHPPERKKGPPNSKAVLGLIEVVYL